MDLKQLHEQRKANQEARLLWAALILLTTRTFRNNTPDEVLVILEKESERLDNLDHWETVKNVREKVFSLPGLEKEDKDILLLMLNKAEGHYRGETNQSSCCVSENSEHKRPAYDPKSVDNPLADFLTMNFRDQIREGGPVDNAIRLLMSYKDLLQRDQNRTNALS